MLDSMKSLCSLSFVVLAVFVLAACGENSNPVDIGSVLHRGMSTDPETLDAHKARSTQAAREHHAARRG